jgi:hypothetical protein
MLSPKRNCVCSVSFLKPHLRKTMSPHPETGHESQSNEVLARKQICHHNHIYMKVESVGPALSWRDIKSREQSGLTRSAHSSPWLWRFFYVVPISFILRQVLSSSAPALRCLTIMSWFPTSLCGSKTKCPFPMGRQ